MTLSEKELLEADDGRLEELFRMSPPGDIPKGPMEGTAIIGAGSWVARPVALLVGLAVWRGKVFYPEAGYLSNRLSPLDMLAIVATVTPGPSLLDERDCIVIDYSRTSLVVGAVRDELRQVGPDLYLGLIWVNRIKIGWFTLKPPGAENAPQEG
ncbi:hypothetical protein ACIGXI_39190 [Kitasatospora aureofaciens]|uniref:hypothetical protein n=1 Tax=Kitasatospora aureofaciens TaxID=1894 RepID=UPI0037CCA3D2